MATEYLYPNSNVNTLWSINDYTNINDVVVQPSSAADGTSCKQNRFDDNEEQEWGFENSSELSAITDVTVWVRCGFDDDGDWIDETFTVKVNFDSTEQISSGQSTTNGVSADWKSATTSGSWSPSDLDDLSVSFDYGGVSTSEDGYVYSVYIELTGTAGGGGSSELFVGHDVTQSNTNTTAVEAYLSRYGVADVIHIPLKATGVMDFAGIVSVANWQISKDGGAFASFDTEPARIAVALGGWVIQLSATEMQAKRILITADDSGTDVDDTALCIKTYGDSSASVERLPSDVKRINGSEQAGTTFASLFSSFPTGVIASGSTTTAIKTDLSDDDFKWDNHLFMITSGDRSGEVRKISSYTNTNGLVSFTKPLGTAPAASDTFAILGRLD